jgi:hypothetical protein
MSPDFWEKYVNPDSRYRYDENTHRFYHYRHELLQSEGGSLKQDYNKIRDSEIQSRNTEIFQSVTQFYFSRNGIIVLAVSVVLCLVTSVFSLEGLFFWNVLLFIAVLGFYELTVRKEVRAEWEDVQEEIETL